MGVAPCRQSCTSSELPSSHVWPQKPWWGRFLCLHNFYFFLIRYQKFTIPDIREHAMRPREVATQTLMTVYSLLSLSQTTVSTAGNNVVSRSKWKWMWEPYAVDGELLDSDCEKVATNKPSLPSPVTLSVVLSMGMSMRDEKTLSEVRLKASISQSLVSEGLGI